MRSAFAQIPWMFQNDVSERASKITVSGTIALLLSCVAICLPMRIAGAAEYSQDAVKAAFLYRFAGYVEWPQQVAADTPFTIAVLTDDGVAGELQKLLPGKRIKDRPARVVRIRTFQDLEDAQILYVGAVREGAARSLIGAIGTRPVLIVTDEQGGLDAGSTVNFLLVDRRVRFEISLEAAERANLRISSDLLSLAARVQGKGLHSGNPANSRELVAQVLRARIPKARSAG